MLELFFKFFRIILVLYSIAVMIDMVRQSMSSINQDTKLDFQLCVIH